jgi:hypothetical protein
MHPGLALALTLLAADGGTTLLREVTLEEVLERPAPDAGELPPGDPSSGLRLVHAGARAVSLHQADPERQRLTCRTLSRKTGRDLKLSELVPDPDARQAMARLLVALQLSEEPPPTGEEAPLSWKAGFLHDEAPGTTTLCAWRPPSQATLFEVSVDPLERWLPPATLTPRDEPLLAELEEVTRWENKARLRGTALVEAAPYSHFMEREPARLIRVLRGALMDPRAKEDPRVRLRAIGAINWLGRIADNETTMKLLLAVAFDPRFAPQVQARALHVLGRKLDPSGSRRCSKAIARQGELARKKRQLAQLLESGPCNPAQVSANDDSGPVGETDSDY